MSTSEAERRKTILDAARRLLCQYGPNKTTVAEIAREASVGVGSLYLEFSSKEAIIAELSDIEHAHVLDAIQRAVREKKAANASFADQIAAVFDARTHAFLTLKRAGSHTKDLLHCEGSASSHATASTTSTTRCVSEARDRFEHAVHALLAELLTEGNRSGSLDVAEPGVAARGLLYAYAAFAPPRIFWGIDDDVEAALQSLHRLLACGILRR